MDDPFADLRKKREANQEKMRKELMEQEHARRRAENELLERKKFRKKYEKLVVGVLEQVRRAAFPELNAVVHHFEETSSPYSQYGDVDWYIGSWNHDSDDGPVGLESGVGVLLLFDENNKPKRFRCSRPRMKMESGLSREELIECLRRLLS